MIRGSIVALALVCAWTSGLAQVDVEAAERRYRVARRLAAERAPAAAAALDEVIRLAPDGPLVDDALVDAARLEPLAERPESIGELALDSARRALERLDRALSLRPPGDRALEARYLRALVRLEPLPGHDADAARADLTTVATSHPETRWSTAARHALAWVNVHSGRHAAARATLQRILVDHPGDPIAGWSALLAARLELLDGQASRAALLAQQSVEAGVGPARVVREAAVRELLGGAATFRSPLRVPLAVRSVTDAVTTPDGGLVVVDRRRGEVVRHAPDGRVADRWRLDDPRAVAGDQAGRTFVAAGEFIWRLDSGGTATRVAALGEWAPIADLAVGAMGTIWVLDRRGETIGVVHPGATGVAAWADTNGVRHAAIEWDGRRLVGLATRDLGVTAFAADGTSRALAAGGRARFDSISAGPSGRTALLERRGARLARIGEQGIASSIDLRAIEIARPRTVAVGADGSLHVIDDDGPTWVRLP